MLLILHVRYACDLITFCLLLNLQRTEACELSEMNDGRLTSLSVFLMQLASTKPKSTLTCNEHLSKSRDLSVKSR